MMKIIIADDHPIVREGLIKILEKKIDSVHIEQAGTGMELMEKVRQYDFDIVLLDITLPDTNGLDVLERLKIEIPKLPVLILSIHSEEHYAIRAYKAGAGGYLKKDKAPEELLEAIRKVAAGGKYVSSDLAEIMALALETGTNKVPHEMLSNREYEVMCLIASGKTVSQIADMLALSVRTVSTYRARILEKMQMKSNAEITHYAISSGIVE